MRQGTANENGDEIGQRIVDIALVHRSRRPLSLTEMGSKKKGGEGSATANPLAKQA